MTAITVAAAQIACRPGDIAGNLALHLAAVAEARARDVDCLVFPELSLTDYMAEPDTAALGRPADCAELLRIADAAGPMSVSVGFIERGDDGRVFNTQALVGSQRRPQLHRKLNLPTYGMLQEGLHFAAGTQVATVAWRGDWTLASLICADAWNPALPWLAALQGTDLLLVPVASSLDAVGGNFDNPEGWTVNLRHTALTYGLPVVMANHCGDRNGLRFWGGSRILDASGRELARLGREPGLIVARLDKQDVRDARVRLPTVRDADPGLIAAELRRILASSAAAASPA